MFLEKGGYTVHAFTNPTEALRQMREFMGNIHLLLTDVTMPEMDGITLARHLLAERPSTRVLLMSGYSDVQPSGLPLLKKPFSREHLLEEVERVLAGAPTEPSNVARVRDRWRTSDIRHTESK